MSQSCPRSFPFGVPCPGTAGHLGCENEGGKEEMVESNTKKNHGIISGSLAKLSPLAPRWTAVTPMSSNRSAAGVTVFEGRIYVSGGHDGLQIFNSVRPWGPGQGSPTAPQDGAGSLPVLSLCLQTAPSGCATTFCHFLP